MRLLKYLLLLCCLQAFGQAPETTTVFLNMRDFTGTSINRKVTYKPIEPADFATDGTNFFLNEPISTNSVGGVATVQLIPNNYLLSIEGIAKTWRIPVSQSDTPLNAALLMTNKTAVSTARFSAINGYTMDQADAHFLAGNGVWFIDPANNTLYCVVGGTVNFSVTTNGIVTAKSYRGNEVAVPPSITPTVDWGSGTTFRITVTANTTVSFANTENAKPIDVLVSNTGSYTATWPAGIKWSGGSAPVLTTGSKSDIFSFYQIGGVIYGSANQNF